MATTIGRVQRLFMFPGSSTTSTACATIGPSATNAELLFVQRKATDSDHLGAFKNSMIDALATALAGRQVVTAGHGNTDAEITSLRIDVT